MGFFEEQNGRLIFRENGETVQVEAWGTDSLRVRSRILSDIEEGNAALLKQPAGQVQIQMDEWSAEITNGNIKALLEVQPWGKALQMSFYNQKGELLLREISNGGSLVRKARYYRNRPGGSFYLKATFESNPKEKIFGMGQYQQERMDLKGCNLELAHRNSQASIPF